MPSTRQKSSVAAATRVSGYAATSSEAALLPCSNAREVCATPVSAVCCTRSCASCTEAAARSNVPRAEATPPLSARSSRTVQSSQPDRSIAARFGTSSCAPSVIAPTAEEAVSRVRRRSELSRSLAASACPCSLAWVECTDAREVSTASRAEAMADRSARLSLSL
eukprot:scaffold90180_cov75-Phaeocystis_antarctica.AAC.8